MSDLSRLRSIAEAATPGPWEPNGNGAHTPSGYCIATTHMEPRALRQADAEHITTFDPPTVLALLDVAEAGAALSESMNQERLEWSYPLLLQYNAFTVALTHLAEVTR